MLEKLRKEIRRYATKERAEVSARFFKTGAGQYGHGDIFVGVTVPDLRRIAKIYRDLPLDDLDTLLASAIHEERFVALIILVSQFQRGDAKTRDAISRFYISHADRVNNWDLVDTSAPYIFGAYLRETFPNSPEKRLAKLQPLATSKNVWKRRIAMLATFHDIRNGDCSTAIPIAGKLLNDEHDLIQKAVGWMLREVGKNCSSKTLETFLDQHAAHMPRTALRYAIERLPKSKRLAYMAKR